MPLYEYQCESCNHRFERIQKYVDPPIDTCPNCGGKTRKLFSSPAIQFKGTGWYITDYARKGSSDGGKGGSGKSDSQASDAASEKAEKAEKAGTPEKSDKSDKTDKPAKSDSGGSSSSESSSPKPEAKAESK